MNTSDAHVIAPANELDPADPRLPILDQMLEGCLIVSFDWRVLYANDVVAQRSHLTPAGMIGRSLLEIHPRLEDTDVFHVLRTCMTERTSRRLEIQYTHTDGRSTWFDLSVRPQPEGLLLLSVEITERKHADESFREVQSELEAVVEASPVPIVALDLAGNVLLWSGAAERLFGWSAAEVLGRPLPLVPDDKVAEFDEMRARTRTAAAPGSTITVRVARDGRRIPVSVSTAPLRDRNGEPMGMVGVLIDLTEQTALRDALSESDRRFASTFEASPMANVLIRAADRKIVEANKACLDLFGLARDQVIGNDAETLSSAYVPADSARFWAQLATHSRVTDFEFQFDTATGRHGDAVATAQKLALGGEDYVFLMMQDVTARRSAERALKETDDRFRQLADTIEEVFWLTDVDKRQMVYVSPGYERIWGRPCRTLYENPRDWLTAIHADDRDRVARAVLAQQEGGVYDEEYRIVRPDGSVRWIRDRGFPVRDATGRVFRVAGSAQDVTNRRELEAQVRETQKMESVGLLAGGVAHDFNNLLTVIQGNCDALLEVLPPTADSTELLGEIHDAGERAAGLTRQLLAFSRREVVEPRVVDLHAIIVDTEKMLRRILGEDVVLAVSLGPESSQVKVDPGSWAQVLMNLAVNARDAMPRGGKLTIATGRAMLDGDFVRAHPHMLPGTYVTLAMTDTGSGMPPEVLARIFEPFFTTKGIGKGTGLGLSVVHGIVARSGGVIEVSSELGVGTTFRAYVPAVDAAVRRPSNAVRPASASGSETILVVEDEESIRRIAVRALKKLGYTLLQAGDGEAALVVAAVHSGPIHLLVTDVVMPLMDGRELAEALRAGRSELKTLYTSGYTDDAVMRHGIMHAEVSFLAKPYDATALRQKVRAVLDEPRRA